MAHVRVPGLDLRGNLTGNGVATPPGSGLAWADAVDMMVAGLPP